VFYIISELFILFSQHFRVLSRISIKSYCHFHLHLVARNRSRHVSPSSHNCIYLILSLGILTLENVISLLAVLCCKLDVLNWVLKYWL